MKVHVHANCQALAVSKMLLEVCPDWDVTWFEAHADEIVDQNDLYRERVRTADLILSQPIHPGYRSREELSLDWVCANARPGATLLVFPSLHFGAHLPGTDGFPIPGIPLYSNIIAMHLVAAGCSAAETVARMTSPDLLSDADIEAEIEAALAETRRRETEDAIDVPVSSFLSERCRIRPMFHIPNHPFRETTAFVVNAALARLGSDRRVAVRGVDYQPEPHIPPLASMSRFMRANGSSAAETGEAAPVVMHGVVRGQAEYFAAMAEPLARLDREELTAVIGASWPTIQVLRRLAANGSAIPGIGRWRDA